MALEWIHEPSPRWDAAKAVIVGGAPRGAFLPAAHAQGARVPGEWWRVEEAGRTLAFGWMDAAWDGGEILLAVSPDARGRGVGGFVLGRLCAEASARGFEYVFNAVRAEHPDRETVTAWLVARGFQPAEDGLLRRRAGPRPGPRTR